MSHRRQQVSSKTAATTAVVDLFGAGMKCHQAGRLADAEAYYRRVLTVEPSHADALNMLGVVAQQVGRSELAIELIRQAIRSNGSNPAYFHNLGHVLREQGKVEEAISAIRRAIGIKPDIAEGHFSLGCHLHDLGRLEEAVVAYRDAIRLDPDLAEAHSNLGNILRTQGRLDEALSACREAIRLKPGLADAHCNLGTALFDHGKHAHAVAAYEKAIHLAPDLAEAHYNLGRALCEQGKRDEAIAATRQAIRLNRNHAEAHSNLGSMLQNQAKLEEAVVACRQAIRINPQYAEAHMNLGAVLFEQGRLDEALGATRQAIRLKPTHAEAHSNLGSMLREQGMLDEAVAACRQAIRIKPPYAEAHLNLGAALADQGRPDEAVAIYCEAIRLKADFVSASSALAFCMNYMEKVSVGQVFEAHREWDERHGRPLPRAAYTNDRSPGRRLMVGYVSPDFRQHSVAYFLEPLLRSHDRNAVEVFCYADVSAPDARTQLFKGLAHHWMTTVGMSDEALAERIRNDGIDILVDLAGHTAKNRLPVFARKPAPVQVTWLGYPNTTGLDAIDYRLVDAVTDPEGKADAFASEALVRLPEGFLCYGVRDETPAPTTPPCLSKGFVTFGSLNNPAKLSAATLDAWAQMLTRLPAARLLLKGKPFTDAATRALYLERLAERGVAAERLELVGWLPDSRAHLALYGRVDVALDPFPYNGTTTTCEALWMGVPVVTLSGDRHAGRVGASLLTQIGVTDLIADSIDAYVEMAVALAGDPTRLADLRRSLRPRMAASSLCDTAGFARKVEDAYRTMWARWCATSAPPSGEAGQ
jgi:protein O-GlcNAc transferase